MMRLFRRNSDRDSEVAIQMPTRRLSGQFMNDSLPTPHRPSTILLRSGIKLLLFITLSIVLLRLFTFHGIMKKDHQIIGRPIDIKVRDQLPRAWEIGSGGDGKPCLIAVLLTQEEIHARWKAEPEVWMAAAQKLCDVRFVVSAFSAWKRHISKDMRPLTIEVPALESAPREYTFKVWEVLTAEFFGQTTSYRWVFNIRSKCFHTFLS